ncbi:BRCT domain-containing protein [uncultured Clostridium sp.]|uniref:3'-5' exonuclease n=1 Tax=uncultured Clostridium sp. TaxID=59620 RepID=UPI0025D02E41|nr:BRCT domain-containing protein [uncultured Clostridium sp.]
MINPKREWRKFESHEDKIEALKELKLVSPKANDIKTLYYKGAYTENAVECDVVGIVDNNEIILDINGELHSIHPDYLLDMQKKERFIIVDIETPRSFKPADGIREVAAIVVEDYRVIDSLHLAIINDEEQYKNGYGDGLDAIEENEELKSKFKALVKKYKCPLVAHNASFDRNFLRYWGWVEDNQEFYCSMNTIKIKETLPSYKLVYLLEHYNIKKGQAHNALQDVLDLLELLKVIKPERWSALSIPTSSSAIKKHNKESKDSNEASAPANRFKKFAKDKEKVAEEKEMIEFAKNNLIKDIFNKKKIVFTGDMSKSRGEMRATAIRYGADSPTSISGKTNMLVIGEEAGKSKLEKAKNLGIDIITEKEFWDIINNN